MKAIFFFNAMLTPKIILGIYWAVLLAILVYGLGKIGDGNFWWGVGIIVGGGVLLRIWCELLIVLFKIHENLRTIAESKIAKAKIAEDNIAETKITESKQDKVENQTQP